MEWFTRRRFLYLAALFTEPEFQGRDLGRRIIEEMAHRKADREGLVSYLQETAAATPFYVARDRQPVEIFKVDLKG